ncbi:Cof-type HAD-IIB family hydrolase [Halocella sp. SP3-1]|uniref:Cof-type HAD-IIB family hydrolase n=1 Tax=Halocella sp. SP3-1 TaxID=2382161 RepID=UPI000F7637CB|nr:Cof-type HAD-IIB family hydrolase [Halocella sp. SP3-1]AZO94687.1 HAD family phosphatase [Halocella sp. SP3-1]
MSYKMVAIDLDGTLLSNHNIITKKNETIIKELKKRGILFTIASGRPYQSVEPYAKQLKIELPLITTNGALVKYLTGDTIYEVLVAKDYVNKLVDFGLKNKLGVILYYKDKFETFNKSTAKKQWQLEKIEVEVIKEYDKIKVPLKIVYCGNEEKINQVYSKVKLLFKKDLYITQSDKIYLEFMNSSVSKGIALKKIMERYNFKREEVIAIGNNHNDLSMFEEAGTAVAMGNSPFEIKKMADLITDSNNDNGVFNILHKLFF